MKFLHNIVAFFRKLFGITVPVTPVEVTEEPQTFLEKVFQPSPGEIAMAKAAAKRGRKLARTLELKALGGFCTGHGDQYRAAA